MSTINKDRVLSCFLELVQLDSPSGKEAPVAAYCIKALEEAGCTVRVDDSMAVTHSDTGNIFANLAAFGQTDEVALPLYFSAHMDTVSPGIGVEPVVEDGYIYSKGNTVLGGDDKAGIAAIIELVRCLKEGEEQGIAHPSIGILLSVREEQGLVGAKAMDPAAFDEVQGAFCYVLDAAGSPGLVVNGAPYQYSYRACYTGRAAHAGIMPEAGISAIRAAACAISKLPQGRLDDETTTNIGTITGGSATNVVAEECVITGELRSHSLQRVEALKATIHDILTHACTDELNGAGPAEVAITWEVNYEGFFAPASAPQVQKALAAAEELGLPASTEISGGGADTNILAARGLAAVSLGCGMENIHSTNERLSIEDLWNLSRLVVAIAR